MVRLKRAIAQAKRQRGSRQTSPEINPSAAMKSAVATVANINIRELNKHQLDTWEETGRLVCPHGQDEFQLVQLLPVIWQGREEQEGDRKISFAGAWEWFEQVGPFWAQCFHDTPSSAQASFWLPADAELEFN